MLWIVFHQRIHHTMDVTSDKRKIHEIIFSRLMKKSLAFFAFARISTEIYHCKPTFVQVCSFHPKLWLFMCLSFSLSRSHQRSSWFGSKICACVFFSAWQFFSIRMQSKLDSEIFVQKFRHHKKGQKHSSTDIITDIYSAEKKVGGLLQALCR